MVANLILLCSLKTYLSFKTWKHLLESRGYLIHLFFSGGHLSTHCFQYLRHYCVHFFSFFYFAQPMPLFCNKTLRDSNKNLEHLFGGWKNLSSMFLCSLPVQEQNIFGWIQMESMFLQKGNMHACLFLFLCHHGKYSYGLLHTIDLFTWGFRLYDAMI